MNRYYLLPFLLASSIVVALPKGADVKAGSADFHVLDPQTLKIITADKSILEYAEFHIGKNERVQFLLPSKKASVLNRVVGNDPSHILGNLEGNGRILFVNPNGIYFGPQAVVNSGSFIASTLDIRDEDFLNDRYIFSIKKGREFASIINEGKLSVGPEGFIALLAPFIENRGSVLAQAGKVILAAGEKVMLDFSGDGLIGFVVEGELEKALIQNFGKIQAVNGVVDISMHTAKNAIQMVVNTDGITPANAMDVVNGVVRLSYQGEVAADAVHVEGSKLEVSGSIEGSEVHILGDNIQLMGAKIDASGDVGGGTVLIGGEYQGGGDTRTAVYTVVDEHTVIDASARESGDGGRVIVWADDTTLFDGKIYARGGAEGGDGGFVETSGEIELGIQKGFVDTSAPQGAFGNWLLDPATINIATGGAATIAQCSAPNCADNTAQTIAPATIAAAATNVSLCAQRNAASSITVTNAVTMTNSGVGLTLTAGSGNAGAINLNSNITTIGGAISLVGTVTLGAGVTLDTTNAGGAPAGANISFSSTLNGAQTLSLNGGTGGVVTFTGAAGATTALSSITVTAASITQTSTMKATNGVSYTAPTLISLGGNVTSAGGVMTFTGPVTLAAAVTTDSTNAGGTAAGANINFLSTINGAQAFTMRAGTAGVVSFSGAVGGTTPLTNFTFTSAASIQIGANITTTGTARTFPSPVTLTGISTIISTNQNITFSNTINGAQALTVAAGTGTAAFSVAVGGTTPLSSLTVTAASITQTSNVQTTGAISYTGSTLITLHGNLTSAGGAMTFTGPVSLTTTVTADTTNAGGTAAGANIGFSSTINSPQVLNLNGGTAGIVTLTGAVGGTTALTSLNVVGATITQSSTVKTTGVINYTAPTAINLGGNLTSSGNVMTITGPVSLTAAVVADTTNAGGTAAGANINFSSTIDGAQTLSLKNGTAGILTLSGAVGGGTALTSITVTAAAITQSSSVKTTGAINYTGPTFIHLGGNLTSAGGLMSFTGPVLLTAAVTADTTNAGGTAAGANINFSSTIDGAQTFSLNGGTAGVVTFSGAVGPTTALTSLTAVSSSITQSSTVKTTGAISYTAPSVISLGGNLTSAGGIMTLTGPVTLAAAVIADTTNAGGTAAGANINFSSTINGAQTLNLKGGTAGVVTLTGAVGAGTALTSLTVTGASITQGSTAKATGAISYTAPTLISLGGNLVTSGGVMTFTGPVSLSAGLLADTTNAGGTAAGANISFSSTLNGAQNLTLTAGTAGVATLSGAVGGTAALTTLTATAATITQSSTVKTTGAISYTAPTLISLGGNLTSAGGAMTFTGPVSLTAAVAADTTNAGGTAAGANIGFSSTINGAQTLSLNGGTAGVVTLSGAVGGTAALASLTAASATITQSSTVKTTGAISYTAATLISLGGNLTSAGGIMTFTGPVSLGVAVTADTTNAGGTAAGANINFSSTVNGAQVLTLRAGTGGVVSFSGAVGGTTPLTGLTFTSASSIQIGANITTTTSALVFPSPVVLTGTSNITSTNQNISFNSTINGAQGLTITGGTGVATFTGAVGGTTALSSLTATAATITQSSTVKTTGAINYTGSTLINLGGSLTSAGGAMTFTGPVSLTAAVAADTTNAGGTAAGANIGFSSTINGAQTLSLNGGTAGVVTLSGAVGGTAALASLTATGATITQSSTVKTTGAISYTAPTLISLGGNLTSAGGVMTFTGPVSLTGAVVADTTNAGGTAAGANINFSSTINGAQTLSLNGGTAGVVTLSGAVGGTTALTSLTATAATITQSSSVKTTGAISYTAPTLISLGGNLTSAGGVMTFTGPVTLAAAVTADTTNAGGTPTGANISFSSTINGANPLTLNAGTTGSITLTGAVGGVTRIGALTFTNANNITANAITAASITQTAGQGTTTFNGVLNTNTVTGISLAGNIFNINANVTTTSSGPLTVSHIGLLTVPGGVTLTVSGGFNDLGPGPTIFNGSIVTSGQNITFTGPLTLANSISLSTGTGVGNILFQSTVDGTVAGAQNLTLAVDGGNITFSGAVGGTTRLGILTINSANNVTAGAIKAASFNQTAGTGTSLFNGAIDLNTVAGFSFVGHDITINSTLTTTNSGPVSIQDSGTLTLGSSANLSLDGPFTQSGTGVAHLAGTITTTNDTIQVGGATNLLSALTLNTGAGIGNIVFSSTVDGPGDLSLAAGTGSISLSSANGSTQRLGAVVITSASSVAMGSLTVASINETGVTGLSTYADINTINVLGTQLTGNTFTINGNLISTNAGPFTVTNAGLLNLTAGASTSLTGAFTQNGAGSVQFAGKILTANANISFATPVTLTNAATFSTGAGGGSILFSNTIDGTQTLSLNSGTGNITLSGVVGGGTALGAITIPSANNVTAAAVTASSITQASGTGTTTFNGALITSTVTGINLTGAVFTFNSPFTTTTGSGVVSINNSGLLTMASGATGVVGGTFSQVGTGLNSLANSLTASGAVTFSTGITIPSSQTATVNTAAAFQNISFLSTIDGPGNLTVLSGAGVAGGDVLFWGVVGGGTRLGALTISSAHDVSSIAITAASIVQSAGSGTTTLTGDLNTNAVAGISLTVTNLATNGSVVTTALGPVTIVNSSQMTSVFGASTSIAGAFNQSGGGAVSLAGQVVTVNQPLHFSSALTLTADTVLNSGSGGSNTLSMGSTINGAHTLTLISGTGSLSVSGAIGGGTALTSLTVTSANNASFQAISAGSLTQSAGTGTTTFNGAIATTAVTGISLTGSSFHMLAPVTTTNGGPCAIAVTGTLAIDSGAPFTVGGAFTQTGAGGVSLGDNITTTNSPISFASAVSLTGGVTLNTGVGGGNVTFSSTVSGAQSLSVAAGVGDVSFSGAIGSTALSALTVSGNNISVANIGAVAAGVSGTTQFTAATALNFNGTTYNTNTQIYSASTINLLAGALTTFTTNSNPFTFTAGSALLSATTNLTVNTGGGALTLCPLLAPVSSLRTVILNAGAAGTVQLAAVGAAASSEFTSLSITGGDLHLGGNIVSNTVSFTTSNPHQIFLGGDITTAGTALTFPVAVVRDTGASSTLTTNAAILFQSTIDGDGTGTRNLTLTAGTGNITFTGDVGSTNPLITLTISTAANVTAAKVSVSNLIQSNGTGTTTFNGALSTTSGLGINLTGAAFTFNNTVTTTGGGGLVITNSGALNLPVAATVSLSGVFNQLGTGTSNLADSITSNNDVLFSGPVVLTGATSISTSASNKTITFLNTINGTNNLTLAAGTSSISIGGNIGSITPLAALLFSSANNITVLDITANSIVVAGGSGTTTVNGNVVAGSGGITLTGNNFVNNGNITTTNGGSITVNNSGPAIRTPGHTTVVDGNYTINGPGPAFAGSSLTVKGNVLIVPAVTLASNTVIDTSGGNGNITFSSTVNGGFDFNLIAGLGNIALNGAVGGGVRVGNIIFTSATNVTTVAVTAASIRQLAGTGTTAFNGALSTNGALGIAITTNTVTRGAAITTLNNGPLTITNSGLFTSTAAGAISLDGAFTQDGTGNVNFSGSIVTTSDALSFSSPIALAGDATFNTGVGIGDITLSQTVQGAHALNLDAGTGSIVLSGAIGTLVTPLTSVNVVHATNISAQAITAGTVVQQSGTGTSTFSGALTTTASGGISLIGAAFTFNAPFTTQAASTGPFHLTNSGLATFAAAATGAVDAAFTQDGAGAVSLANTTVVGGVVQFLGMVSIPTSQTAVVDTHTASTSITFSNSIDGPGNLTVLSGTAPIVFSQNVGSTTRLGNLLVTSAGNWTTQGLTAATIAQSAGSGLTLFQGALNTNAVGGINLTGSQFTFLDNATTTALGPISITNSGLLTTTAGKTLSSSGAFTQSTGAVSLAGSIVTSDADLTFGGAVTLTAATVLDTGSVGAGTIHLTTVNGAFPFTLTAGTGDISVTGNIGAITRLGAILVTSVHDVNVQDMTSASITQLAGSGTSSLVGDFNTNGAAGILMIGTNFTRTGAIVTTGGGSLTVTNSGLLTGTMINTTSIDGSYTQNGTGPVHFAGNITTVNGPISFSGPMTLLFTSVFDSSANSQNITLSNTVNGFAGTESLTFIAGDGSVALNSAVGGTTSVGPIVITSADNFTTQAVRAQSIATSSAMGGIATFNGTLATSTAAGIVLSGNQFVFNNITTTGTGPLTLTNSGNLTFTNGTTLSIAGDVTQTGGGAVSIGSTIATTNGVINLASNLTLTAATVLNTSVGGNDITIGGSIDGAQSLTFVAGGGDLTVNGLIGAATPLTALIVTSAHDAAFANNSLVAGPFTITSSTGTTTLDGTLTTTTASGISLSGNVIQINDVVTTTGGGSIAIHNTGLLTLAASSAMNSNATFAQTGAGSVTWGSNLTTHGALSFASPITITADLVFNTGGGLLTLSSTIDSNSNLTPHDLMLIGGSGSIVLGGAVGNVHPIDDLIIQSANNVTAAAITSNSIRQIAGTGLTHFTGLVTTDGSLGVNLTGNQFTIDQAITTIGNGPVSIAHTGTLTLNAATHLLTGPFSETGGGSVMAAATIQTVSDTISWTDPVTLTGNVTLDTTNSGGSSGANITIGNTVNGPFCLTLVSGTEDIQLDAPIGLSSVLNCFAATGALIIQNSSISTTNAVQETGAMQIGGNITTNGGAITLTGNITQTADAAFSTSGGAGNIHITGTIDPNAIGRDLTITTAGTVAVDSPIGSMTSYDDLTITASTISWNGLGGAGAGATGTTTLTAVNNINFTGVNYNGNAQLYTAGAQFNMDAAGTTVASSSDPITFTTGTILQNAGDLTIDSNGGAITMENLLGPTFNFTANALTGSFTFNQIGALGQNLNVVNLTANTFTPTPVNTPNPGANVFATSLITSGATFTTLSGPQTIPASFSLPVLIDGTVTFTCGTTGDVVFTKSVNADVGGGNLSINFGTCTGSALFQGLVGNTLPMDFIHIDQATDVMASKAVTVGSFIETSGTGSATFTAGMTTNAAEGVNIAANTIVLSGGFATMNAGPMALAIANAGALSLTTGTTITSDGTFTQTGLGAVSLSAVTITPNSSVSFAGPVTLDQNLSILTSNVGGSAVTFSNTIDGTTIEDSDLTITAGAQDIAFSGTIGGSVRLGGITINSARNVTNARINALDYEQLAGTGTTTFNGTVTLSGAPGMVLTGNNVTLNNSISTTATNAPIVVTNAGTLTLGTGANLTPSGNFQQNGAGLSQLAGQITAGGNISFATAATLNGSFIADTSANDTNISFATTIDDALAHTHGLTLIAGDGDIFLTGAIGSTTPIGAFVISSADIVTTAAISAASIVQTVGTGSTTISGNLSTTGVSGISLTGKDVSIASTITTANAGPLSIAHTGLLTLTLGASTLIDGAFTESGLNGSIDFSGTLKTNNQALFFTNPIDLIGNAVFNSNGGTLTLNAIDDTFSLDLTAAGGNIIFNGSVGVPNAIGAFTIHSANNITYPIVNALSVSQVASAGTTTINGAMTTTGSNGISLTGAAITQNFPLLSLGTGPVTVNNSGTFTIGSTITSGGAFSQTGSGSVLVGTNIIAADHEISFTGPITLTGSTMLKTGPVGNDIVFGALSTIDGAQDLNLIADGGTITFNAAVGGATRIGALTIQSALNVVANSTITAASISQAAGSGTTTFNQAINTNDSDGISLFGTNFTVLSSATTTGTGSFALNNAGLFTLGAGASLNIDGGFSQMGSGSSTLDGSILTHLSDINFSSPVVVTGVSASLDSHLASQPITFQSTLNGPGNLTLNSGSSNIVFDQTVGGLTALNALAITNAANVTIPTIFASSISQAAGSGTTQFSNNVTTTGSGGIALTTSAITFLGNATLTGTGPMTLANAGFLTFTSGKTISVAGAFHQTGAGSTLLGGTILTQNAAAGIEFNSNVVLTAPAFLNTSSGAGTIALDGLLDGTFPLSLTAGTGTITVTGLVGSTIPLGQITIVSAFDVTVDTDVTADSLVQQAGTGTTSLMGDLTTTGSSGIAVIGNNFFLDGDITTSNNGPLHITNAGTITDISGSTRALDGSYIQDGPGDVLLAGIIATNNSTISLAGPITLNSDVTLNSGATGAPITLTNTVNGSTGTESLTLSSGSSGSSSITQPIGATQSLLNLTIIAHQFSLANVGALSPGVTGTLSATGSAGGIFTGTNYRAKAQTYAIASGSFQMNAGALTTFNSGGSALTFSGGAIQLAASTDLTLNTTGGALQLGAVHAGTGSLRTLILNSGASTTNVGVIGTLGNTEFSSVSITGSNVTLTGDIISNSLTLAPTGTLFAGGSIFTTNTPLSFPTAVVLNASNTFSTGSTGANILFSSTVNGNVNDVRGLTLSAGTGSITFTGIVGGTGRLSSLQVQTCQNMTVQAAMTVDALVQFSGSGTTTFNGPLTVPGVIGIQLTGTNFAINNTVTTLNNASLTVTNSGTLTLAGAATLSGAFSQLGAGSTQFSGSIVAHQPVTFTGPVNLSGNPSIDTSASSQAILFQNTVDGAGNLTVSSGTSGDLTFMQAIGSITPIGQLTITTAHNITSTTVVADNIQVLDVAGTAVLNGSMLTLGPLGFLAIGNNFLANNGTLIAENGGTITFTNSGSIIGTVLVDVIADGGFTQNGTGPVFLGGTIQANTNNISFSSPITIAAPSDLKTVLGSGTISFASTVDGAQPLKLTAGGGDILFNAPVGTLSRSGAITIVSAQNVAALDVIAQSLTQNAGSGVSTFGGVVNTNGLSGIQLTGNNFVRGGNWVTTNSGTISVNNTGTFTSTAATGINADGTFMQIGSGPVLLGQTVQTNNSPLLFTGSVTLASPTTILSGTTLGTITFNNTVNGAQPIILNSGGCNMFFNQSMGGSTRLGSVTIQLAKNATFQNLTAATLTQLDGNGTTTFNGTVDINTAAGAQLAGTNFTINQPFSTSNTGSVSFGNAGVLTIGATTVADGNFTQTNALGPTLLNANLTSNHGTITFTGSVSTTGLPLLTTSNQPISLLSTLNGPGGATFNPGGSNVLLQATAGAAAQLGTVTFNNIGNLTTKSITASAISQTSGTGTTTIVGNLTTSAVAGMHFTGNTLSITGTLTSTNLGPCILTHAGNLTLNAGQGTQLTGSFTESGAGTVFLSGNLHALNAPITFNRPITLTAATTLNSDGGADITIVNPVDGFQVLNLDAGDAGNILVQADIGSVTPIISVTIVDANNVTTQAITAGSIVQTTGNGTSSFGALTTTTPAGIALIGNAFTLNAPVNTFNTGSFDVTNAGLLSIVNGAPLTINGEFSQLGTGNTSLCDDITAQTGSIQFTGPVTLCHDVTLDTGVTAGDITFGSASTINGAFALTLFSGVGDVIVQNAIGNGVPLTNINVTSAQNVTVNSITADAVNYSGVTALSTFNGPVNTTGAIALTGHDFVFNNSVMTSAGAFTLTNAANATFAANQVIDINGAFLQNGTGDMFMGGTLTTHGQNITISEDLNLIGNLLINSNGGNIHFLDDADGFFNLTIQAGTGNLLLDNVLGDDTALNNFTVASAHDITLNGIGSFTPGVIGMTSLTASNMILFGNNFYAGSLTISAGTTINFTAGAQVFLTSTGGDISITHGDVVLSANNDLFVNTNNGNFSFVDISGTAFENITINTGSGAAHMNVVDGSGLINTLTVNAGVIDFAGAINVTNADFTALQTIFNTTTPVAINSLNTATFNALSGNVGTLSSPILVNTTNQIFAGAFPSTSSLADFDGSSFDNTVHALTSNPPCEIIFNGVVIKNCTAPPTPPSPSPAKKQVNLPSVLPFAVPGFDSSSFNLGSYYFFQPYYFDDELLRREIRLFYIPAHRSLLKK